MTVDIQVLARQATEALIEQRPITVRHEPGWERNGFPLPIKRMPRDSDGGETQEYRPLAILEYANDVLSGAVAARKMRERKTEDGEGQ